MIAAKLTQRRLVQLQQDLAQLVRFGVPGGETLPVNRAQRADEGVSVLAADFAILVAVAVVETWIAHATLLCSARNQPISSHPGTELQPVAISPGSYLRSPLVSQLHLHYRSALSTASATANRPINQQRIDWVPAAFLPRQHDFPLALRF